MLYNNYLEENIGHLQPFSKCIPQETDVLLWLIYKIIPPYSRFPSYFTPLTEKKKIGCSKAQQEKIHCYDRIHLQEQSLEKEIIVHGSL